MATRKFVRKSIYRAALAAAVAGVGCLTAPQAMGAISVQDYGTPTLVGSNAPTTISNFSITSGADVLVVELADRDSAALALTNASITFNGQALTGIAESSSQPSYRISYVFYLYNPSATTGSLVIHPNGTSVSEYVFNTFSLAGVDTTQAPLSLGADGGSSKSASVSIPNVVAGSVAAMTQSIQPGSAPLSFTDTVGGIASGTVGPVWTKQSGSNLYGGGGYVTNLTAGTNVITGTWNAITSNKNALEAAVFAPLVLTNVTWAGGVNGTWDTSTLNWNPTAGGATTHYVDGPVTVTFDNTGLAQNNITVQAGGVGPSAVVIANTSGTYTIGGGIIGNNAVTSLLVNNPGGAVVLSSTNNFVGGTTVTSGSMLTAGADAALAGGSVTVNGGTVKFTSATPAISSLAGSGGSIVLGNASTPANTQLTIGSGNATTSFAGAISDASGSAAGSLVVTGSGALTLSGASTYSGGTTLSGGKLYVTNTTGSGTGSGAVTVNSGIFGGTGAVGGLVTINSGTHLTPHTPGLTTAGTLTLNGGLTVASGGVLDLNVISAAAADKIVVNGNLTLNGNETLNVAFPNGLAAGQFPILSFTGTLADTSTITPVGTSAMIFQVLAPGAVGNNFGSNSYALVTAYRASNWAGATNNMWDTTTSNWTGTGGNSSTTYVDGQIVNFDDTATTGNVTVQSAGVSPYAVTFNNNTLAYTLSNQSGTVGITGATTTVTLNGTGKVTFSSPNSYGGGTFLNAGTLYISNDSANFDQLGSRPVVATVNLTFNGGTLELAAGTQIYDHRIIMINSGGATIQVDAGANPGQITSNILGTGALTVAGPGVLEFTNNQTGDNPNRTNYTNSTFNGLTILSGATFYVSEQGDYLPGPNYTSSVITNGVLTGGALGTGTVTINDGGTLRVDNGVANWAPQSLVMGGAVTLIPSTGGLQFGTIDSFGATLNTTPTVTLAGDLNLTLGAPTTAALVGGGTAGILQLLNPIVGNHSLTVGTTAAQNQYLILGSSGSTYTGGTTINSGVSVELSASSVVSGGVLQSGPLGTGLVTLNAGSALAASGNTGVSIANAVVISGNTFIGPAAGKTGQVTIDGTGVTVPTTVTINNAPTLTIGNLSTDSVTIASPIISSGFTASGPGTLNLSNAANQITGVTVSAGKVALTGTGQTIGIASVASGATTGAVLDLQHNNAVVTGMTGSQVQTALLHANATDPAILSSTQITGTGLGYLVGSDYTGTHGGTTTFGGISFAPTDVIVKYTYLGDANLDGKITASDYAQLDASYLLQTPNPTWLQGNFIHDTSGAPVGAADYAAIDAGYTAYLGGGPLAAAQVALDTARFGAAFTEAYNALTAAPAAVPEPASLALLGLGAVALLSRRRR